MEAVSDMISFPLGLAKGRYFCNRQQETAKLIRNIQTGTHTVLISPRRYGKTSLAYRAIQECQLPSATVDLYMTTSATDIEHGILNGVDSLLSQVSHNAEILLGLIKEFIKSLRPTFEASTQGFKIKLEATQKNTSAVSICEALQVLEGVLQKKSQRAVLLIDEFQEVQQVASSAGIEGAIRHVAQASNYLTIIFSGSHRHLLKGMFNQRNKPLYRLCDEILLDRIAQEDYIPFLEKFFFQKWGKPLSKSIIDKIFCHSECHPYYFNAICEKLFSEENMPTEKSVDCVWEDLIATKKKDILHETKSLNITHKKILVAIAHGIDHGLTSQKFLSQADVSGASVVRALEMLEAEDFIEKIHDRYRLIDPLLKSILKLLTYF